MDTRYEVRDAQEVAGILVDEGVADPARIGAVGRSYGGGKAMALAALNDRVMLPDGSLTSWVTPEGTPIRLTAAAAEAAWSDLAYALAPNGYTLDYVAEAPYTARGRVGVMKLPLAAALFRAAVETNDYPLPDLDPEADPSTLVELLLPGEPYDDDPLLSYLIYQFTAHHSAYYIDDSRPPAPLLISNGLTDDLVPADEAIRFYNRTRTNHPGVEISLLFGDFGHPRAQNKEADLAMVEERKRAWFDYFLKGEESRPKLGVEVLTQACGEPSTGPLTAPSWAEIAPGEVRFSDPASKIILPTPGDLDAGQAFSSLADAGACATASGADRMGTASYRLPGAPTGGFTLLGSPTIVADIDSPGPNSQIAARLLDVGPDGEATLVARGVYRPEISSGAEPIQQVFQLHPNGWRFDEGHIAKLELLSSDVPYARPSDGQAPITVSDLELRLPVLERPDGGPVRESAPKAVPDGYDLAIDF
jgi:predicted acyl esterase